MKHLTNLFTLLQLSRSQPQTGYVLASLSKNELPNLAEHHYLVTFIGWQIATHLKEAGAIINVEKVLALCLIHDLGELLGGDIAMPYGKINPKAREYAKAFEKENLKFLTQFFGSQQESVKTLSPEVFEPISDEALIAKIADYIEVAHFQHFAGINEDKRTSFIKDKLLQMANKIEDVIAKQELQTFIESWPDSFIKATPEEILKSQ